MNELRRNLIAKGSDWRWWVYAHSDTRASDIEDIPVMLAGMNEEFWDKYLSPL